MWVRERRAHQSLHPLNAFQEEKKKCGCKQRQQAEAEIKIQQKKVPLVKNFKKEQIWRREQNIFHRQEEQENKALEEHLDR